MINTFFNWFWNIIKNFIFFNYFNNIFKQNYIKKLLNNYNFYHFDNFFYIIIETLIIILSILTINYQIINLF